MSDAYQKMTDALEAVPLDATCAELLAAIAKVLREGVTGRAEGPAYRGVMDFFEPPAPAEKPPAQTPEQAAVDYATEHGSDPWRAPGKTARNFLAGVAWAKEQKR